MFFSDFVTTADFKDFINTLAFITILSSTCLLYTSQQQNMLNTNRSIYYTVNITYSLSQREHTQLISRNTLVLFDLFRLIQKFIKDSLRYFLLKLYLLYELLLVQTHVICTSYQHGRLLKYEAKFVFWSKIKSK